MGLFVFCSVPGKKAVVPRFLLKDVIKMLARALMLLASADALRASPPLFSTRGTVAARYHRCTMRLPPSVLDLLPTQVTNHAIFCQAAEANWDALCACYPTEEATLAAVTDSRAILLPYGADMAVSGFYELGLAVDRSSKIASCFQMLQEKLDSEADVLEVITKNPGVLGSMPSGLEKASADDVRRAASVASGVNGFFGPARRMVEATSWWDEGVYKGDDSLKSEKFDPLARFGDATDLPAAEKTYELPAVVLDETTYLYDFDGRSMGIEHLLFTEEGEPVAVWSPETGEVEEIEIVDEEPEE